MKGVIKMEKQEVMLINTIPAVRELRKVPGFDPLKFLRKSTPKDGGTPEVKLNLRYKRLWFRLACPNGRLLLNPLRITDQMAIFEARVFLSRDDELPIANYTVTQLAKDVPDGGYVKAAQDAALNVALDNAGFGIQLCDVTETPETGESQPSAPVKEQSPVASPTLENSECPTDTMEPAPQTNSGSPSEALTLLRSIGGQEKDDASIAAAPEQAEMDAPEADTASPVEEQPQYTEDMSVEEIRTRMMPEDAAKLVVPIGICKGWTMEQVSNDRPTSLKWYAYGCDNGGNILKAAALILLDNLQQKAG
jgi:hypothetical protein